LLTVIESIIVGEVFSGPYVEKSGYKGVNSPGTLRLDYMIFTEKESGVADDPEETLKVRAYLDKTHTLEYLESRKGPISESLPHK